jgi:hypothetical protein
MKKGGRRHKARGIPNMAMFYQKLSITDIWLSFFFFLYKLMFISTCISNPDLAET